MSIATTSRYQVSVCVSETHTVWLEADDGTDARDKAEALWLRNRSRFVFAGRELESAVIDRDDRSEPAPTEPSPAKPQRR